MSSGHVNLYLDHSFLTHLSDTPTEILRFIVNMTATGTRGM